MAYAVFQKVSFLDECSKTLVETCTCIGINQNKSNCKKTGRVASFSRQDATSFLLQEMRIIIQLSSEAYFFSLALNFMFLATHTESWSQSLLLCSSPPVLLDNTDARNSLRGKSSFMTQFNVTHVHFIAFRIKQAKGMKLLQRVLERKEGEVLPW